MSLENYVMYLLLNRRCVGIVLCSSYHYAGRDGNPPTTVSIRHNIPKPNAEEGYGNEPHRVQQVCVIFVVEPEEINRSLKK